MQLVKHFSELENLFDLQIISTLSMNPMNQVALLTSDSGFDFGSIWRQNTLLGPRIAYFQLTL